MMYILKSHRPFLSILLDTGHEKKETIDSRLYIEKKRIIDVQLLFFNVSYFKISYDIIFYSVDPPTAPMVNSWLRPWFSTSASPIDQPPQSFICWLLLEARALLPQPLSLAS
jgi:hypothetical protein